MRNQNGQAALIIILVTAVVVTIIASTVGRTVADVRLSTQSLESTQALGASEAGLEHAVNHLASVQHDIGAAQASNPCPPPPDTPCVLDHIDPMPGVTIESNARYWYDYADFAPDSVQEPNYLLGEVDPGDHRTIWLTDDRTNFFVEGSSFHYNGEVDVTFIFDDTSPLSYEFMMYYFEPCDASAVARVERFVNDPPVVTSGDTVTYDIGTISDCAAYMRIRPLSDSAILTVSGYDNNFQNVSQGILVTSNGAVIGVGQGDQVVSRRLQMFFTHPEPPSFIDFVFYEGNS